MQIISFFENLIHEIFDTMTDKKVIIVAIVSYCIWCICYIWKNKKEDKWRNKLYNSCIIIMSPVVWLYELLLLERMDRISNSISDLSNRSYAYPYNSSLRTIAAQTAILIVIWFCIIPAMVYSYVIITYIHTGELYQMFEGSFKHRILWDITPFYLIASFLVMLVVLLSKNEEYCYSPMDESLSLLMEIMTQIPALSCSFTFMYIFPSCQDCSITKISDDGSIIYSENCFITYGALYDIMMSYILQIIIYVIIMCIAVIYAKRISFKKAVIDEIDNFHKKFEKFEKINLQDLKNTITDIKTQVSKLEEEFRKIPKGNNSTGSENEAENENLGGYQNIKKIGRYILAIFFFTSFLSLLPKTKTHHSRS